MNTVENTFAIYIFSLELLFATFVYLSSMDHRKDFWQRIVVGSVIYSVCLLFLVNIVTYAPYFTLGYGTYCVLGSIFAMILVYYCCYTDISDVIYCVAAAYTTQHMTYCLHCVLFRIESPDLFNRYSVSYFFTYACSYFICYWFFAKKIMAGRKYGIKISQSIYMALITLSVTLVLSSISQFFKVESPWLYTITMIYASFSCFMLLFSQKNHIETLKAQKERDLLEQLWVTRKAQYELSRENISLINQKCHDLKHQIGALRTVSENEEKERRLTEIEQSAMIYDAIVESGNDTIDTVLTEKSLICERNKIILTCVVDGGCLGFMDTIDLYTLFGNALDNAIECVTNLHRTEQRIISVSIFSKASFVFIQCENYYENPIIMSDGLPQSTKEQNGYHGYGMLSIRQIAEKYGGFLTIETNDHVFLLRITIPLS